MQRAEVVFFMRDNDIAATEKFLSQSKTAVIDQSIVDLGGKLYRSWNSSHKTDVNDCLLAAAVIWTGGVLYTLNKKHYPMQDLVVKKAW